MGSEEAVLKAAHGESADATQRIRHSFYASLYLGLYYQALSDESKALDYMKKGDSALQKQWLHGGGSARASRLASGPASRAFFPS